MIHFDVKKKKISIFLCLLSILLIVFILSYRNANTRLPDSVKEYYEPGDVTKELEFIQKTYGVRDEEVLLLMRNAVDAAFASDTVKEKLYRKLAEK